MTCQCCPLCLTYNLTNADKDPKRHSHQAANYMYPTQSAGHSRHAAYLANVCVSGAAQRQGVGQALLTSARREAATWGEHAHGPEPLGIRPAEQACLACLLHICLL